MVIETISLVDQVLFPPLAQFYPMTYVNMTWAIHEGTERSSTCLVSKFNNFNCSLISEDESTYFNLISGELLIAVNFTVAKRIDDTSFQKFLPGSAKPSMIRVWPWLNIRHATDAWFGTNPWLEEIDFWLWETDPWSRDVFLLFPNVHLRATLTMRVRQTMAAFGHQKVSCDAQNSPMSLIVCSASKFIIFQYRQSVSRPRPAHYW